MTREEAIEVYHGLINPKIKEAFEFFVPELRKSESDDERIRKRLVEYFKGFYDKYYSWNNVNVHWEGLEVKKVIAYLEKQKTSEEAIRYVKENHSPNEVSDFQAAMNIAVAKAYDKGVKDTLEKQKSVEYIDKDKVYTIMTKLTILSYSQLIPINSNEFKRIQDITSEVRSLLDYPIDQKPEWSEEDSDMICEIIDHCITIPYIGGTLRLSDERKKELKTFVKSLRPQPKQEWSDKDEDFINMLILHFNYLVNKGGDSVETYKSYIEGLKSLRPSWKPSEEQISDLEDIVKDLHRDYLYEDRLKSIDDLIENLKKLM